MIQVQLLSAKNSIANQFLSEMRDHIIQQDSLRFRRNMERLGEIFAYEISKTLAYTEKEVVTPLGIATMHVPTELPVLAVILRAGLPFHAGFLNFFDKSENAFVSAYRKHHKDGSFTIQIEYISSPPLDDKVLIIIDPMLATGNSIAKAYRGLLEFGKPKHTHIATIIASTEGISTIRQLLIGEPITIWAAAVDEELTAKAYIVPGLGDAGDLAFGNKE